jgi:hypothetical protein
LDHKHRSCLGGAEGNRVAFGSPLNDFLSGRKKARRPFEPGSGFRHIIIKGERQVVKTIVPGLSATGKFAGDVDKLRILPIFCFGQAWKAKKMGEKIGFLPAI